MRDHGSRGHPIGSGDANETWAKRFVEKFRTDRLEREVLLRGACPQCNLPTGATSEPFSCLFGPGTFPSLGATLVEVQGTANWRSCNVAHTFLSSVEWARAALVCWRCQRPLLLDDAIARCSSCSNTVELEAFSSEYGPLVSKVAAALGLAIAAEGLRYLDWDAELAGFARALEGKSSTPRGAAQAATVPASPRGPMLPALKEIYERSVAVNGGTRYSLLGLLGVGGFAKVHLAQTPEPRLVVIKQAWGHRTPEERGRDRKLNAYSLAARKLHAEADYLKGVAGQPRIPQFIEHFESDGEAYLAMEFIHGPNLREFVGAMGREAGGLDVGEALRIFKQAADVVRMIHGTHRVHRDITPRNFLMRAGNPILIDFGTIARDTGPTLEVATGISAGGYHAPEQARGVASRLCDIYSLGSCLYFMLTGEDPPLLTLDGRSEAALLEQMRRRGVPASLQDLVSKCRALEPEDRPDSVDAVLRSVRLVEHPELRACARCGEPIERQPLACPACGLRYCSGCGSVAGDDAQCGTCGRLICPWCGTAVRGSRAFCPACGASTQRGKCVNCGQPMPGRAPFCRSCGAPVKPIQGGSLAA